MMAQERAFKGVWIPAEIWLSTDLTVTEKIIYAEIDSFCNRYQQCFAGNKHFAELAQISENRVSHVISELIKKGYIHREIIYADDGKTVEKRLLSPTRGYCYLQQGGIVADNKGGIVADNKYNNTINNNTVNNIPPLPPYGGNPEREKQTQVNPIQEKLQQALNDFYDMRKKIRKPMAERAKQLAIRKLQSLASDEDTQIKIIEQSILNGWQSFYELKEDNNGGYKGNRSKIKGNPRFRTIEECERVFGVGEGTTEKDVPFT